MFFSFSWFGLHSAKRKATKHLEQFTLAIIAFFFLFTFFSIRRRCCYCCCVLHTFAHALFFFVICLVVLLLLRYVNASYDRASIILLDFLFAQFRVFALLFVVKTLPGDTFRQLSTFNYMPTIFTYFHFTWHTQFKLKVLFNPLE